MRLAIRSASVGVKGAVVEALQVGVAAQAFDDLVAAPNARGLPSTKRPNNPYP